MLISNGSEGHTQQIRRDRGGEPSISPVVYDHREMMLPLSQLALEALNEKAMIGAASRGWDTLQITQNRGARAHALAGFLDRFTEGRGYSLVSHDETSTVGEKSCVERVEKKFFLTQLFREMRR